jgi:uncharacterized membrane protein (DUF4010 family)
MEHLDTIPPLLVQFLATVLFSFLIGMEFRSYQRTFHGDRRSDSGEKIDFGATRTFTFIGILGFVLYSLDPRGLFFGLGLLVISALLSIYYWRQSDQGNFSVLVIMLPLLTYLVGPISIHFPRWFLVLFVVVITLVLAEKTRIRKFSDLFDTGESTTLAKFLILSGVILPLLPDHQIAAPWITVTYYQVWLAVIVVSTISYLSYLAQTFFFKAPNLLFTGILGGLYSSTATSVVIGRRARVLDDVHQVSPALILATTMMYLRLWALVAILGHVHTAIQLTLPFATFILLSTGYALWLHRARPGHNGTIEEAGAGAGHPLELPTAFIFAFLFVFFAFVTQYVLGRFGANGLHFLSFIVGFTDIDPFILSLLAGKFQVGEDALVGAVLIASGSNNLLKAAYAIGLSRNRSVLPAALWLLGLCLASVVDTFWVR